MDQLEATAFAKLRAWAESQVGPVDDSRLEASREELAELIRQYEILRIENGALQKQAANKTLELEHAYELQAMAIRNLSEGVLITGDLVDWPGPEIIFANAAMERITGYPIAEIVGQTPRMFQGPATDRTVLEHVRTQLAEGRSVRCELINYRKNGTAYEAELFIAPVMDETGAITNFVSIHTDVSARKHLNRELIERQGRLRAILDTAVESIVTIDEFGRIEDFNPAAEELFGYEAKEVIGRKVNVLMPPPYREEHDGYLEAYLETGERKIIGIGREVQAQRRDGSVFPIDLSVSEFQANGQRMFTGIIRDISERKAYEHEARIWQEELERRVEEGTRELTLANEELRDLNFFIAHDLKTPIRAVHNYVDFLAEALEGKLEGDAADDLKHLKQANQELHSMVEDLLAYSQLGQGRHLTPTENDIRSLIDSIGSQLTAKNGHRVTAEGEFPTVHAPEFLLRQIFQNLLENGLKYNESETPEIKISARRLQGKPASWEFKFEDNGIGIDAKHHEEIFRMFRRLHTDDRYVGTGIGLAGVKKAAQLLGGAIRLESSPGEGSAFFVRLPERARG